MSWPMLIQVSTNPLFNQIEALLRQFSPAEYQLPLASLNQGTLGQHLRHILEFYDCLLKGLEQGVVDYEARVRNLQLEQDPAYALAYLHQMEQQLLAASPCDLRSRNTYGLNMPVVCELPTTLERELVYLAEHTVHHLAIVAIGLRTCLPHIVMPKHLGIAESTIRARLMASQ